MQNEHRKASDVLLDLEKKLDVALSIISTQDLNIKILSNKLNNIIEMLEKRPQKQPLESQKNTIEAVNSVYPNIPANVTSVTDEKNVPISSEFAISKEDLPKGFRRTSRPETFAGDDSYLSKPSANLNTKYPTQVIQPEKNESDLFPPYQESKAEVMAPPIVDNKPSYKNKQIVQNAIPVSQRVVNKDGKSLFLADVEIIDLSAMQSIFKTRTNGTGKWSASLGIGSYRVIINKRESSTGPRLEATQDIQVNGNESKLDLPTIIIKP